MAKMTAAKKAEIAELVDAQARVLARYLVEHSLDKLWDWDFNGALGDNLTDKQYDQACQQVLLSVAKKWIASHKRRGRI